VGAPQSAPRAGRAGSQATSQAAPVIGIESATRTIAKRRSKLPALGAVAACAAALLGIGLTLGLPRSSAPSLDAVAKRAERLKGSQTVQLQSDDGVVVARAVLTTSGQGYLLATALPSLANDRTYQLWVVGKAGPVSIGLLGPRPGVHAFSLASGSPSASGIQAIAVSVEPIAGSTAPTATPVAAGKLA
jgi:anti-sigma-K factor RskA